MKLKLMAALAFLMAFPAAEFASAQGNASSQASTDVWSVWRKGFESYEKAEAAVKKKDYKLALTHYRASLEAFRSVKRSNPDWNKSVISYRIDLCLRRIRATQELRDAVAKTEKPKAPVHAVPKRPAPQREDFVTQSLKMRARLAETEKELAALKRSVDLNKKAAEQVKNLLQEKKELVEKNNMLSLLLEDSKEKLKRADRSLDRERRIAEERAKVTALSDKIRSLNLEIKTLKSEKSDAYERRNAAEYALKQSEQRIAALTASVETAKLVQKENQLLQNQLEEIRKDRAALQKKLDAASAEIAGLNAQLNKIREGIDLPENIRRIQDNANIVMKDNEYLRTLNAKNMKELELLRKSSAALSAELEKVSAEYKAASAGLSRASTQSAQANEQLALRAKESENSRAVIAQLQQERDSLKNELTAFSKRYEALLKNSSRTDSLSVGLAEKEKELQALAAKTAGLEQSLAGLRKENETLVGANAALSASVAALTANAERLSAENQKLKANAENLRTLLADSQDFKKKMLALSAENEALKKNAAELEKFAKGPSAEFARLQRRSAELKKELDRVLAERAELQKLVKESKALPEIRKKYQDVVANNNRLSEEYARLKQEFEQFKASAAKVNQAGVSAAGVNTENAQLKREAEALRDKIAAYERKIEVGSALAARLAAENARLKQNPDASASAEYAKLKAEYDRILPKFEVLESDNAALRKSISDYKDQYRKSARLVAENEKLREEYAALRKTVADGVLARQLKELDAENKNLRAEVQGLRGSVERLLKVAENPAASKEHLKRTVDENSALKTEVVKQRQQLESLNAKLAENEKRRKENDARLSALLTTARTAQEFLKQREAEIRKLTIQIDALKKANPASASELVAEVTALKEGKAQFESAILNLNAVRRKLESENALLKRDLELVRREADSLKKTLERPKPQGELERRNLELVEAVSKYEKLYAQTSKERNDFSARIKTLDKEIADAKEQLAKSAVSAERMRKELKQWTDDPIAMNEQSVYKKNLALDQIVGENDSLRREIARLQSELTDSRDALNKSRSKMIAMEKRFQKVLFSMNEYKKANPGAVLQIDSAKQAELDAEEAKLKKHREIAEKVRARKEQAKKTAPAPAAVPAAPVKRDPSKPADEQKFTSSMKIAAKAEKENNSAVALMNYWRAVDAWPESVEAYAGLVRVYLVRGDKASAQKAYETARKYGFKESGELEKKLYGE